MKKIAFWNNYTNFAHNEAFNPKAYGIGEDMGLPLLKLKEKLEKNGFTFETLDMGNFEDYDYCIFSDVPNKKTCCVDIDMIPREKKILILSECDMIYKPNKRKDLLNEYKVVFAYNDNLVSSSGYKKLCIPIDIKTPIKKDYNEKKLLTLISGNKNNHDKGELYSERLRAIRFMEKNHIEDFDLYGIGWDLKTFSGIKPIRILNRIKPLREILAEKRPSYKGKVDKKIDTLSNYKFCICYENTCLIPGYISEKIWDCFFAGCIPVYYGAPNVIDYIPDNCFIDFRNFSSYEQLYQYMKNMNEETYNEYASNIAKFLQSKKVYPFSSDCFVDTMINEIIK